jgi:hypothetical protein
MKNLPIRFEVPGLPQAMIADSHDFKTGSRGYFASGKIALPNGERAQVSCSVVIIGSKPDAGQGKDKALAVAV